MAAATNKLGPRARRIANRDALALVEQQVEKFVRERMKPDLVRTARQARNTMRRQDWR